MKMACKDNNNADNIITTPQRKRKREPETSLSQGLTNAGFCSTPKNETSSSIHLPSKEKRNARNSFTNSSCLEVKSIVEIASLKAAPANSYEIIRKPPKKKKKHDIAEACFINPALNLEVPYREFNPFEVKRMHATITESNQCFINPGLNIRTQDNKFAINPFEIIREKMTENSKDGFENPALEIPTSLTIAVPFQPTVDCRIDFTGLPLENLTPSKLLAEKLVFTPNVQVNERTSVKSFRRSLSVISEETVDIGKELDCYQLELENSINEARIRKKDFETILKDVEESIEQENVVFCSNAENNTNISSSLATCEANAKEIENIHVESTNNKTSERGCQQINRDGIFCNKGDNTDGVDLKYHTPFVRSYRKPYKQEDKALNEQNIISEDQCKENEERSKMTNVVRKSLRKLIRASKFDNQVRKFEEKDKESVHFFDTLRRSLRRKPKIESKCNNVSDLQSGLIENQETNKEIKQEEIKPNDISILDTRERKVFRSISSADNFIKNDEKKVTFRTSFRKSTKEMRNQIMKSVFQKKVNEYDLRK